MGKPGAAWLVPVKGLAHAGMKGGVYVNGKECVSQGPLAHALNMAVLTP